MHLIPHCATNIIATVRRTFPKKHKDMTLERCPNFTNRPRHHLHPRSNRCQSTRHPACTAHVTAPMTKVSNQFADGEFRVSANSHPSTTRWTATRHWLLQIARRKHATENCQTLGPILLPTGRSHSPTAKQAWEHGSSRTVLASREHNVSYHLYSTCITHVPSWKNTGIGNGQHSQSRCTRKSCHTSQAGGHKSSPLGHAAMLHRLQGMYIHPPSDARTQRDLSSTKTTSDPPYNGIIICPRCSQLCLCIR
jgi:hypothetical protein